MNQDYTFHGEPNWDYAGNGSLWRYNLNYFECLEQPDMDSDTGYALIDSFLQQYPKLKTGHDPYPISLRLVFWVRFFIRQNRLPSDRYLKSLSEQVSELRRNLEYHLLGNHLLENAFALFFTSVYLGNIEVRHKAERLLRNQLDEQILEDGGHFELSPMYHQLMLYRLLDVINIGHVCVLGVSASFLDYLETKASIMLGWMQQMCFSDGTFPLFNDAAYGVAPAPLAISAYAERLNIFSDVRPLGSSGYRKWKSSNWEMIMDIGMAGPSYQPGHSHCDALSFQLRINQKPIFVDTGTSVYGGDIQRRTTERSTASHNTVQIDNLEQSEIWGDFRMGAKAVIEIKKDYPNEIEASLFGFYPRKSNHVRKFKKLNNNSVGIIDEIFTSSNFRSKAYFHFHPSVDFTVNENSIMFREGQVEFGDAESINIYPCHIATEFGQLTPSFKVEVVFFSTLHTTIIINN